METEADKIPDMVAIWGGPFLMGALPCLLVKGHVTLKLVFIIGSVLVVDGGQHRSF